ncbi:MAG: protein kinase, partial [Planctomycetota bacterium]
MVQDQFIGRTIGSYRILSKLGEGGMGAVYKAIHVKLDREVAFKILPERLVQGNPQFVERFFIEARAAAKVMHPNIVQVFDAEEFQGLYYIAMEFVKGMDIKGLLAKKSPLSELEAVDLTLQAAAGLGAAMDQGIIHRDIKPANMMVTQRGVLKIADFGLAKNVQAQTELTQSGQIMGTPAYMSPEQGDGQKVDFRADMYSLGVCLYEMVTGGKPFIADTPIGLIKKHCLDPVPDPIECRPGLDSGFRAIVLRMLAKSRDARFGSYDELIAELKKLKHALEDKASGAAKADASSEIIAIVESSMLQTQAQPLKPEAAHNSPADSSGTTPTPETRQPSGIQKAMKDGVTLKPLHIALIVGATLGLAGVVVVALTLSGVFSTQSGSPGGSPSQSGSPGKAAQADPEDSALKSLALAKALKEKGDAEAAISALDSILVDYPSSKATAEARQLRETWLEEKKEAAAREEAYRRYMNEADASLIAAKRTDKPQDWALVIEAAQKAKAIKDTKEARDLIAFSSGRRDFALAREAEARGDFEEAIRLVALAGTYGVEIVGTGSYLIILRSKKEEKEKAASRKRQFNFYSGKAREEEKKTGSDPSIALDFWKKAETFADSDADKKTAASRIAALGAEAARREAKRKRDEAVAAGKSALAGRDFDAAERHFNEAMKIVPGDAEATRGLADARSARVEAAYRNAMQDGAAAEASTDWKKAEQ